MTLQSEIQVGRVVRNTRSGKRGVVAVWPGCVGCPVLTTPGQCSIFSNNLSLVCVELKTSKGRKVRRAWLVANTEVLPARGRRTRGGVSQEISM